MKDLIVLGSYCQDEERIQLLNNCVESLNGLSKGGAILTDSLEAYHWFKRARYSGRRECSYHDDYLDMIGWNFYMMPELAARGLLLMNQFYNIDGSKKHNQDLELPYPDLSKFEIYKQ
jgi:hypothetical protein